ncbi:hypothetical protein MSG28_016063 [Choristoneura fumiferana]|uniref:Uncharacterized protein n=1 Tax=Choristoneura fumiferana TaxID=7141 RepID=A0ACC0K5Q9_CHOFU|nr:hypothetical protein MSG28_016063 [Choristoneura fumiferana]
MSSENSQGVTSLVESKKYDVELEAYQLYGDNLAGVLAKFRKSADYIKILYKKAKDLRHELADVRVQILAYYEKKLKRQLQEMFGLNTVKTTKNPTSPERYEMIKINGTFAICGV